MEYKGKQISGRDIATVELLEEIKAYFSEDGAALNALALGGVNATRYALKTDVDKSIADLVGAAPEALDTLYEISAVLQENVADIDTILTQIGTKANQTDLDEAIRRISTLENTTPTISSIMGSDPIGNASSFIYWNGSGWKTQEINKSLVGLGDVENTKLSTWGGSQNLATLGTVTSGTWKAGTIDVAHGGTGRTSLTSGYALVGNGTGAVSLRAITSSAALESTSLITSGGVFASLTKYMPKSGGVFTGNFAMSYGSHILLTDSENTQHIVMQLSKDNDLHNLLLGQKSAAAGYPTYIYGHSIIFSYKGGSGANKAMTIDENGNVTIEKNLIVKGTSSSGGKAIEGQSALVGPLSLNASITTGTKTQTQMNTIGFTTTAIANMEAGIYTKVVYNGLVWEYSVKRSSSTSKVIYLRNDAGTSYTMTLSGTTWTIS